MPDRIVGAQSHKPAEQQVVVELLPGLIESLVMSPIPS
jgi:hypothetical protein